MLYPFKDVCIMGAKGNKVNRERTWLREIFALVKVFFQLVEFGFNATYHRHILTGPEPFCEDCLFLVGVFPARPFFLAFPKAGDSPFSLLSSKHRLFFQYFAGQDSAPVETDTSGPARLKAGPGGLGPYITR